MACCFKKPPTFSGNMEPKLVPIFNFIVLYLFLLKKNLDLEVNSVLINKYYVGDNNSVEILILNI
jgi:hypothetical protein